MEGITITGIEELSQMLTQIAPKAAKAYLVKCARPAAQLVIDEMSANAPVAPTDGGTLRDSIVYRNQWQSTEEAMEALVTSIGPNKHVPWGMWQEFGTSNMEGKHWMTTAWDNCKDNVLAVYIEQFKELEAKLIAKDQSEAELENDDRDRATGHTSASRLRRDRNEAYRENDRRDRQAGVASATRIQKDMNRAYKENMKRNGR